jgi:branched-chain amino acid transport system substrate-binding protein
MRMNPITRRAALALAATAALAAPAFAQEKVLKLGSIFALSGPNASIGKEALGGAQFAVQKLNREGLTIGGDKYKVELVNVDDESKAERSVAAAEKLIGQDNVPVILMPPSSTTTLAVIPIAEKNKRIAMSFVAAAPQVVSPDYKFSFRNTLTSIMNVGPAVEYLVKQRNVKSIAYIGRNDDWGRAAGKAIAAKAAELGGKVVVEEYFEPGSTDFYGLLTKVRAANPDAMISAAFIEDGVSKLKQYRELQLKPLFMSVSVIATSPGFLSAAGKAADGILVSTGPTTSDTPALAAFREDFQKATGGKALPFGITAYDTVRMLVEAMKKAGSTDPEKVAAVLRNFEYKGLLQDYKFANANQSQVVINVNEVKDGNVKVISSIVATQ